MPADFAAAHLHDEYRRQATFEGASEWDVQIGLIVGLILGTAGMGAFMGIQIAQEGRTAVRAVTEALPAWSSDSPEGPSTGLSKKVQLDKAKQARIQQCAGYCSSVGHTDSCSAPTETSATLVKPSYRSSGSAAGVVGTASSCDVRCANIHMYGFKQA